MDFSSFFSGFDWKSLGIDAGIVAAVIGLCEVFKRVVFKKDKNGTKKAIILDVALSVVAAACVTTPFKMQPFGANILRYAGISTLAYLVALKPFLQKFFPQKKD